MQTNLLYLFIELILLISCGVLPSLFMYGLKQTKNRD